jgi:hypothetical protein
MKDKDESKRLTDTQILAEFYSQRGEIQVCNTVYKDGAVLYLQVEKETFQEVFHRLTKYQGALVIREDYAKSKDDSTYAIWIIANTKYYSSDWCKLCNTNVRISIEEVAPHLLDKRGLPFIDNRYLDENTVESYVELIRPLVESGEHVDKS